MIIWINFKKREEKFMILNEKEYFSCILDDFFLILDKEDSFLDEDIINIDEFVESERAYDVDAGISKGAIIIKDSSNPYSNKVLKFNLDYIDGEESWEDFCAKEYENYLKAKEAKLDFLFAPVEPALFYKGRQFYTQDKVSFSNKISYEESDEVISSSSINYSDDYRYDFRICERFVASVISYYGEEICQKLFTFLKDNKINDIHDGNWGLINGAPVVFDYSGFSEEE